MSRAPVELSVAGQTFRIVSSAADDDLRRLAQIVDERARSLAGGRAPAAHAVLLAAISLAHDVEMADARADSVEAAARDTVTRLLARIDAALASDASAAAP